MNALERVTNVEPNGVTRLPRAMTWPTGPCSDGKPNRNEAAFVAMAKAKNANVARNGWPDFLVDLPGTGTIGVEVKHRYDQVRPEQRRVFAMLEKVGVNVYVWHTAKPNTLVPWRKFVRRYLYAFKKAAKAAGERAA